ncbi:sugar ABC transporter substrate-binding protein [Arthrobacter sp. AL08]|uniref:ABC transporter substrate-binding protein n=1 Tax=unclassified Arthrobacter TaxID=235627 RepID=UPI00249A8E22|nr:MULTISPECIES: sugar ABC transporter substrate-binding protein [unclassified Arthrobacter]MDI3241185.1 sugar ABC transporter substrate-binding protein [Arthrobacter sp. AL05]MDI3276839.1 sugar ABC transporter substrate-binding protein [Arthrobacter sp. AL08]
MKNPIKVLSALAATASLAFGMTACGGSSHATNSDTITYWASNQGNSLEDTAAKLKPSLDRFTEKTGVKVKLEVIGWSDLYNRILTAVTSGDGPDVLNIGNTWAVTLQETGAFEPVEGALLEAVGGKDRFLQTSWSTGGADGKAPTSVPLYGLAYNMYYNPKMFKEAGIEAPPVTWDEFVADAKKLTKDTNGDGKPDQWGFTAAGASVSANSHQAFVRGLQNGGALFDKDGKPTFDSAAQVEGVKQWVDLMATDKVMSPSDAEISDGSQKVDNLINGKAAMVFDQSPVKNFEARGFTDWAVAPIPMMKAGASGPEGTQSHVAGINLSVFKNSKNKENAIKLAGWLTSDAEQVALNKAYRSLPVVSSVSSDAAFQTDEVKLKNDALANHALPMPLIPKEGQMETLTGTAIKNLFAKAATGTVTEADVQSALKDANNQMVAAQ